MKDKTKPLPPAWRRAIEHIDRALEQNAPSDYSELIEIFGRQHFGDLWKPRDPSNPTHDN